MTLYGIIALVLKGISQSKYGCKMSLNLRHDTVKCQRSSDQGCKNKCLPFSHFPKMKVRRKHQIVRGITLFQSLQAGKCGTILHLWATREHVSSNSMLINTTATTVSRFTYNQGLSV